MLSASKQNKSYLKMEFFKKNSKSCLKALHACINISSADVNQTTMPYESNCVKTPITEKYLKKQTARTKLANFNSETNYQIDYSNVSYLPFLYTTPEKIQTKLTSTVIRANNSINSMLSSDLSAITDSESEYESAYSNNTYFSPTQDTLYSTQSVNENKDKILVCSIRYEAKESNEMSVEFSDRVKLLSETEEFFLMQSLANSSKRGYVPKCCLISVNQFMNEIKYLKL